MSALINAKMYLTGQATDLYLERRYDIDFEDYEMHFKELGIVIRYIDMINTFSELISSLETGKFELIGYFPSDEGMIDDFLNSF